MLGQEPRACLGLRSLNTLLLVTHTLNNFNHRTFLFLYFCLCEDKRSKWGHLVWSSRQSHVSRDVMTRKTLFLHSLMTKLKFILMFLTLMYPVNFDLHFLPKTMAQSGVCGEFTVCENCRTAECLLSRQIMRQTVKLLIFHTFYFSKFLFFSILKRGKWNFHWSISTFSIKGPTEKTSFNIWWMFYWSDITTKYNVWLCIFPLLINEPIRNVLPHITGFDLKQLKFIFILFIHKREERQSWKTRSEASENVDKLVSQLRLSGFSRRRHFASENNQIKSVFGVLLLWKPNWHHVTQTLTRDQTDLRLKLFLKRPSRGQRSYQCASCWHSVFTLVESDSCL